MCLIVIHGLGKDEFGEERIAAMERAIASTMWLIEGLELTKEDVSFSFVHDPSIISNTIGLTVIVELLTEKPKRTPPARDKLAQDIGYALKALPGNESRGVKVGVREF